MDHLNPLLSRFGTGNGEPARILTRGILRWEIDPDSGALIAREQTEPAASPVHSIYFFRQSGGKWQVCVKFPTGPTQILATEP